MIFVLERIVPPDDEPVSVAELKRHLRTFASSTAEEDDDFLSLIRAGREWAENYASRAIMPQDWRLSVDSTRSSIDFITNDIVRGYYTGFCSSRGPWELLLRRAPVTEILSVKSVDVLGVESLLDASLYQLRDKDSKWPRLVSLGGINWSSGVYRVEFSAGFSDEELIPAAFKQAIKLHAEANYDRDSILMEKYMQAARAALDSESSTVGFA